MTPGSSRIYIFISRGKYISNISNIRQYTQIYATHNIRNIDYRNHHMISAPPLADCGVHSLCIHQQSRSCGGTGRAGLIWSRTYASMEKHTLRIITDYCHGEARGRCYDHHMSLLGINRKSSYILHANFRAATGPSYITVLRTCSPSAFESHIMLSLPKAQTSSLQLSRSSSFSVIVVA